MPEAVPGPDHLADAVLHRWSDLPTDHPMEKLDRRRIVGDRAMLSEIHLEEGCFVPTHAHENEQFTYVLRGQLRFLIGPEGSKQKEILLSAGEVLHLPSNVPHSAEAIQDTLVVDVFSPVTAGTGVDALGAGADAHG